jgi:hypothetical protein
VSAWQTWYVVGACIFLAVVHTVAFFAVELR